MNNEETGSVDPKPAVTEVKENADGAIVHVKRGSILGMEVAKEITKIELNGVEGTNEEDKVILIGQFIRAKVLKQFNVNFVKKNPVSAGTLFMNDGNSSNLKLPPVKVDKNGLFTETLQEYAARVRPDIKKWFGRATQTSQITWEQVGAIID